MTHVFYSTKEAPPPNSFPSTSLKWTKIIISHLLILRLKHPCLMEGRISCWANKSQSLVKIKIAKRQNYKWPPCTTPKIKKKPNPDSISNPIKTTASNTSPTAPTNAITNSLPPKPTFPKPSTATVSSPTTFQQPVLPSTKTSYWKWETSKATEMQL